MTDIICKYCEHDKKNIDCAEEGIDCPQVLTWGEIIKHRDAIAEIIDDAQHRAEYISRGFIKGYPDSLIFTDKILNLLKLKGKK